MMLAEAVLNPYLRDRYGKLENPDFKRNTKNEL